MIDNISKEKFIEIINAAKNQFSFEDDLNNLLGKYNCDGYVCMPTLLEQVVFLLECIFKDKYHWIDYYCYELEFGKKWKKGMITDSDGKDVKLETAEDLYDFITKECANEQNSN